MKRISIRMVPVATFLAGAILLGGAAGCSRQEPPPQPVVRKPAPKPTDNVPVAQKPAESKAAKPEAESLYNSAGRRDPFLPFIKAELKQRAKEDLASLPPLQRYELGELKFVGVIWTRKGARALLEDAEGKGYSVTVGTRIGRSGGVVARITDREIAVREERVGSRGEKIQRENVLQLTTAGGK